MVRLLQFLQIRQRIWVLVGICLVGLFITAAIAIKKAQDQFLDLKHEQYIKITQLALNTLDFYFQAYQNGELDRLEARKLAKRAINNLRPDDRTYFYMYNATHDLLVSHPLLTDDNIYADDTPEQIAEGSQKSSADKKRIGEKLNLGEPSPGTLVILLEQYPRTKTGFVDYYYYLSPEEKYPVVRRTTDDPSQLTEEAVLKTAYGAYYEPWDWVVITGVYREDEREAFLNWLWSMLLPTGLIIGITFMVAWAISLSISRPLTNIVNIMSDISTGTGDLTKRLAVEGRNELTHFARGFNIFVEKIAGIVQQVLDSNRQVTAHAQQLSEVIDHTVKRTDEQLSETEMLASATNELSYSLTGVSERAQNTANAAQSAQSAAQQSQHAMDHNINSVNQLSEALLNTQGQVESMEAFSNKVSQVLDVIVGIAEQTNLLALNAAIEAARAGEQGRGFAVVADEVRTLAQRTQQSTTEIHDIVSNLQSGTLNVVKALQQGLVSSEACVKSATESNHTLEQVLQFVDDISRMNIDIAAAVEQQSAATQEIAQSSQKISDSSRSNLEDNESCRRENSQLTQQLDQLNTLVKQFKT